MPKQAAKLLFLSPFPLGEGPGMGPYVLIGGFYVCPLNSLPPSYFLEDGQVIDSLTSHYDWVYHQPVWIVGFDWAPVPNVFRSKEVINDELAKAGCHCQRNNSKIYDDVSTVTCQSTGRGCGNPPCSGPCNFIQRIKTCLFN